MGRRLHLDLPFPPVSPGLPEEFDVSTKTVAVGDRIYREVTRAFEETHLLQGETGMGVTRGIAFIHSYSGMAALFDAAKLTGFLSQQFESPSKNFVLLKSQILVSFLAHVANNEEDDCLPAAMRTWLLESLLGLVTRYHPSLLKGPKPKSAERVYGGMRIIGPPDGYNGATSINQAHISEGNEARSSSKTVAYTGLEEGQLQTDLRSDGEQVDSEPDVHLDRDSLSPDGGSGSDDRIVRVEAPVTAPGAPLKTPSQSSGVESGSPEASTRTAQELTSQPPVLRSFPSNSSQSRSQLNVDHGDDNYEGEGLVDRSTGKERIESSNDRRNELSGLMSTSAASLSTPIDVYLPNHVSGNVRPVLPQWPPGAPVGVGATNGLVQQGYYTPSMYDSTLGTNAFYGSGGPPYAGPSSYPMQQEHMSYSNEAFGQSPMPYTYNAFSTIPVTLSHTNFSTQQRPLAPGQSTRPAAPFHSLQRTASIQQSSYPVHFPGAIQHNRTTGVMGRNYPVYDGSNSLAPLAPNTPLAPQSNQPTNKRPGSPLPLGPLTRPKGPGYF